MAKARGQIFEANEWFKDTFMVNDKQAEAWTLIGNLHMAKEEWLLAQKKFEQILEYDRDDTYALLSMGNIYYEAKFEKKEKAKHYLDLAMKFYWRVLQLDPTNIYAANGVGMVFAGNVC